MRSQVGAGVDIVAIARFYELDRARDGRMLARIFTVGELADAYAQQPAAQRLAARFSAKEAVVKALGALGCQPIPLARIEIVRGASGAPTVRINHPAAVGITVSVSMAHCDQHAIAYAIAYRVRSARQATTAQRAVRSYA